jgi:uncharacterized protein
LSPYKILAMRKTPGTPCVGICSSGIGDDVCRGCKRFAHEVINWNTYTNEQRHLVLSRLDNFLIQIIKNKIELIEIKELNKFSNVPTKRGDDIRDPYLMAYDLLKDKQLEVLKPEAHGFRVRHPYRHLPLSALHATITDEFFELSAAHYERYIAPGIVS